MKKDIEQDKQDNKTKRDPAAAETEIRIMRTGLSKAMDALNNAMRKIGLLMAKLFDSIFKTNISGSPFLNNKIITGKKFIVAKKNNKQNQQQKNRGGGHVKISKANPSEKDDNLIQIKDVLHGKASDVALQKQQERQAEAGHRFFSKALNINKSQTNENETAMSK